MKKSIVSITLVTPNIPFISGIVLKTQNTIQEQKETQIIPLIIR